jgi:hypothetical protein
MFRLPVEARALTPHNKSRAVLLGDTTPIVHKASKIREDTVGVHNGEVVAGPVDLAGSIETVAVDSEQYRQGTKAFLTSSHVQCSIEGGLTGASTTPIGLSHFRSVRMSPECHVVVYF